MREQGNGRSGPDTEIHRNRWQLAAKRLCEAGLATDLASLATDQMKMLSAYGGGVL